MLDIFNSSDTGEEQQPGSRTAPTGTNCKHCSKGQHALASLVSPSPRGEARAPAQLPPHTTRAPLRAAQRECNSQLCFISSPELNQQGENTAGRHAAAPAEPQHCITRVSTQHQTAPSRGQAQISTRSPGHCCWFPGARENRGMWSLPWAAQTPSLARWSSSSCLQEQAEPPELCKRADVGGEGIKKAPGGAGGGSA